MSKLNDFRLSYETAFLFILSNEYGIPFATLLGLYNISEKIFWSYLSLLTPMSKMGVRKGGQLAKSSNRIFKNIRGIKDRKQRKVEYEVTDDEGNLVYEADGSVKKDKKTIIEHTPIILTEAEEKLKAIMKYYITKGYSNGETFYSEDEIFDKKGSMYLKKDVIEIDGEPYAKCTQIEHIFDKHFPDITTAEYRSLSIKSINELISNLGVLQEA